MNADVVIAGAGIAGLACGAALSDAGWRVLVFERDAAAGGRAASWIDAATGDAVDIGPHVVSNEHRHFMALLEQLGTAHQVMWQPHPFITLLDRGRKLRIASRSWLPPFQGLANLPAALSSVSPRDLISNWRVAWHATRLSEAATLALDHEDALAYLRRMGVTADVIEWFWAPTVMSLLNVPLERCSAAAMMRIFRLMVGRSGYHFGFPRVGLSELFVPGCRRRIEKAGGSVVTASPVRRLLVRDRHFAGFVLQDGREVHSRCGVLALTPQALAQICEGVAPLDPLTQTARRFEPSPYVSTMLWFDRKLTHERFWARVCRPEDLNTDFYDLSNIRSAGGCERSLIACNAIHAHEAWDWSDEHIVAQTRREVADFAPEAHRAVIRHARVHRIPMAIHAPAPGSERMRPSNQTPLRGLWLAGDWTATAVPCSMESAARSAAVAAEAAAAQLGRSLRLVKPAPETTGLVAMLRHP